jgi:hypothetical protein
MIYTAQIVNTRFKHWPILVVAVMLVFVEPAAAVPVRFNKNFETGSLGRIETVGEAQFRCHVEGQYDEHGRNRQANWYYFQMLDVKGRDITLTLTDFVGEYNGQPGACPMTPDTIPVFSYDNQTWHHFAAMDWDQQKKEATLHFKPEQDTIWIAHVPPYPYARIRRLLDELAARACVRTEVIGKTVQGRDLPIVTVADENANTGAKTIWLIARQHAWETGTSYVLEGALRFISADTPVAEAWRKRVVFKFIPTMDPDGCVVGHVRFNANGYDLNRHWNEVDLRTKALLQQMPEIWYVKKTVLQAAASGGVDLLLNLHNDETPEYLESQATDESSRRMLQRLFTLLSDRTSFDPNSSMRFTTRPDTTTNCLYDQTKAPVATMEQRIGRSQKLGRQLTVEDRLLFGAGLAEAMADAVAGPLSQTPR